MTITNKKIIVSVSNDLITDSRVKKVCDYLKCKYDVELIGVKSSFNKKFSRNYKVTLINCFFKRSFLFYAEFNIKLFLILLFKKSHFLLSNDLDTLLPNYMVSLLRNKKIFYDSHECFTETPELYNRFFVKKIWLIIERLILPNLKNTYTVSDSIANFYSKKYNIKMKTVRNCASLYNLQEGKKDFKNIIYQGNINIGRGIELVIKSLKFIPEFKLTIVGGGRELDKLKKIAFSEGVYQRINFKGRLPHDELKQYTKKAIIGLLMEEPLGLSFKYSLPNKLFDYIHAEIPVLASPLLEVKRIIDKYPVGDLLENRDPENIAKQILEIYSRLDVYNFKQAKKDLNWAQEEKVLNQIFS
tara:strand:- start:2158 stop:3228 length:1071 start_codon:yes stop_codon:yes gene_type:complete